jgi:glycosyltransferase involved in cell wall biosynthesis
MPFVGEAVESLLAQSFDDYELVVQDAASTDGTVEYLQGIERAQIVSEPDDGIGDAYNRAFARCTGEIVGTLDADNLLMPNALRAADELFRANRRAAVAYGSVQMIDAAGVLLRIFEPGAFDLQEVMRCELVPPFSTAWFHRARCGDELRFDAMLKTCADFDLWLRLSDRQIVRTDAILGATRLSEKSMTQNPANYEQFCADKIAALDRFLAGRPELASQRDDAVAGIYSWAAESVLALEGPSEQFEALVAHAEARGPDSERLRLLLERAAEPA